jgi:hypothetical protein
MKKKYGSFLKSPFVILGIILVLATLLRFYMLSLNVGKYPGAFLYDRKLLTEHLRASDRPFQHPFGAEVANVAYSIVCKKDGLSNPFGDSTGPTGWVAPGMIFIYAFSFYMFGCYTFKAIVFLFLLALGLSLGIILLVYRLAIMLFDNIYIGYVGALLCALSPHDLRVFKHIDLQDYNFMIFIFLLLVYALLLFVTSRSYKHLIFFALTTAGAVLCNPIFIAPVLASLLFIVLKTKDRFSLYPPIALLLGILMLLISPYVLYQYKRLHVWTFIKSNGMFELYLGNVPDFDGVLVNALFEKYHPIMNQNEFLQYKTLGEVNYIYSRGLRFFDTFDPAAFARRTANRVYNFFFMLPPFTFEKGLMRQLFFSRGLVLLLYVLLRYKRMSCREWLLYVFILSYALPYCLCGIMYRYSIPIVPVEMALAAYIIYRSVSAVIMKMSSSKLITV